MNKNRKAKWKTSFCINKSFLSYFQLKAIDLDKNYSSRKTTPLQNNVKSAVEVIWLSLNWVQRHQISSNFVWKSENFRPIFNDTGQFFETTLLEQKPKDFRKGFERYHTWRVFIEVGKQHTEERKNPPYAIVNSHPLTFTRKDKTASSRTKLWLFQLSPVT